MKTLLASLLLICSNLHAGDLQLSMKGVEMGPGPFITAKVLVTYTGKATNRWAINFIPYDSYGKLWYPFGIYQTNYLSDTNYPFKEMLWHVTSTNKSAFFKVQLIDEN